MDELDAIHICTTYYSGDLKSMVKDLPRINKLVKTMDKKTIEMIDFVSRVGIINAKKIIKEAHDETIVKEPLINNVCRRLKIIEEPENIRILA